jgi:hypothetical protein
MKQFFLFIIYRFFQNCVVSVSKTNSLFSYFFASSSVMENILLPRRVSFSDTLWNWMPASYTHLKELWHRKDNNFQIGIRLSLNFCQLYSALCCVENVGEKVTVVYWQLHSVAAAPPILPHAPVFFCCLQFILNIQERFSLNVKGTVAWDFCPLVLFSNRPHLGPCLLYYIFFRILFRICRVIQIWNSYCAMGHCGEPNFLFRYQGFKTWGGGVGPQ